MNKIKQSHLYFPFIKFEINEKYNNIDLACKSRLDLFYLKSINKYKKILYLDTDILIKGDLSNIFDLCNDDILYVLEEGIVNDKHQWYGEVLFNRNDIDKFKEKSAFTSGIMLFNNCEKIKFFFDKVSEDIIKRPYKFSCYDQPYIVHNAFIENIYDNQILKKYCINNNENIDSNYIINHFPGTPGKYNVKLDIMTNYMNELKDKYILICIEKTKHYIINKLIPIIYQSGEILEDNIFIDHLTNKFTDTFILKIKNICNLLLNKNLRNVCEIGFNNGFSTLLMLTCNTNINIVCFDLCDHKYTLQCYTQLRETFGNRIDLVNGDSTKTMTLYNNIYNKKENSENSKNKEKKFDLIRIDGCNNMEIVKSNINNSLLLARYGTIMIMDNYDSPDLNILWDKFVNKHNLQTLDISIYKSQHHDIKYISYNFDLVLLCTIDFIEQLNNVDKLNFNIKEYLTKKRIKYLKNIWNIARQKNINTILLLGEERIFTLILTLLTNPLIKIVWNTLISVNEEYNKYIKIIQNLLINRFVYNNDNLLNHDIKFDYIFIESYKYEEKEYLSIIEYYNKHSNPNILIENYKNVNVEFIYSSFCEFYNLSPKHLNSYQSLIIK
jgi:hypothetical protein